MGVFNGVLDEAKSGRGGETAVVSCTGALAVSVLQFPAALSDAAVLSGAWLAGMQSLDCRDDTRCDAACGGQVASAEVVAGSDC